MTMTMTMMGGDDDDDDDNDDDDGGDDGGLVFRPERSAITEPRARPGYWWTTVMFALKGQKLLPLQGVFYIPSSYPGRCPGLVADRLSAILEELRLMARTMTMMGAMTEAGISA